MRLAGCARCCQMGAGAAERAGLRLRRDVGPDGPAYFIKLDLHHGFSFLPLSKG